MLTNGSTASLILSEWYVLSQSKEITNWFGLVWANYQNKINSNFFYYVNWFRILCKLMNRLLCKKSILGLTQILHSNNSGRWDFWVPPSVESRGLQLLVILDGSSPLARTHGLALASEAGLNQTLPLMSSVTSSKLASLPEQLWYRAVLKQRRFWDTVSAW